MPLLDEDVVLAQDALDTRQGLTAHGSPRAAACSLACGIRALECQPWYEWISCFMVLLFTSAINMEPRNCRNRCRETIDLRRQLRPHPIRSLDALHDLGIVSIRRTPWVAINPGDQFIGPGMSWRSSQELTFDIALSAHL